MRRLLLLFAAASARYYGDDLVSDSRMPEVLYQTMVPDNVFIGSPVTGTILSNPWKNDTSTTCTTPPSAPPPPCEQECVEECEEIPCLPELCPDNPDEPCVAIPCEPERICIEHCLPCIIPATLPPMVLELEYGYGGRYGKTVTNCDPIFPNFSYKVKAQLAWDHYPEDVVITSSIISVYPNSESPAVNFALNVPSNVKSSRPTEYASLKLTIKSMWENETEMVGMESDAYLALKETDQMLIQSDKAKYKPGNTVQFRIIVLNQDLQGLSGAVHYEVMSPSKNMMSQGDADSVNGVVEGRFQLDTFAEQGEWKIEVDTLLENSIAKKTYTFDVEEYVLPKYEVTIAGDNFIIKGQEEDFPFHVEAKYTFGKPVPGGLKLTVKKLPCENVWIPHWVRSEELLCPPLVDCPITDKNGCRVAPIIQQTVSGFTGSEADVVPYARIAEVLDFEQSTPYCECGDSLLMEAEVTDEYSGEVRTAQKVIKVEETRYKSEWLYEPPMPRPDVGMRYIGKISLIDGTSLDVDGKITAKVSHGYTYEGCTTCTHSEIELELAVDAIESGGIFVVDIPETYLNKTGFNLEATFTTEVDEFEAKVSSYYSSYRSGNTKEELQITADAEGKLNPGSATMFKLKSNYAAKPVFYAIARGKIVKTESVLIPEGGEISLWVDIDSTMIPEVRFLIAENLGTGWAADSVSYFVNPVLDNQVSLTASDTQVKVGDDVDISITAAENSPVYVLGVDQSVLLLKTGNDIDEQKVLQVLQDTQGDSWRPWPIWGGCGFWFPWSYGNSATDKINDAGLKILTVRSFQEYEHIAMEMDSYMVTNSMGGSAGSPMQIKTRKNFPETWLWETVTTDEAGNAQMSNLKVPDTITSWIVTAFSMSPEKGLGLDPTAEKITAFQKFFIKLYLPYSAKQNEEFLIKAVIYNYLDDEVTVDATLTDNDMFEHLLMGEERNIKTITIPKDGALQVAWPVRAVKIGTMPVKVRAVVNGNLAGDELQRLLIIKPEGQKQTRVFNGLLQNDATDSYEINFPENIVPGSQRLELRLFGNIMSNTLNNIDELLKMPYGCGEQNMVNFAPAVFIYRYLSETGKLTEAIRAKATKIIETGYQRELKYRHNGGGFSAFGESSYSNRGPSTLLSSFVLKCFRAANTLLPKKAIDDTIIDEEMAFLAGKFRDGNFEETGQVFSSYLMGALNKNGPIAGTAYTLISFLESGVDADHDEIVQSALDSVANSFNNVDDVHTLALMTYCLTLGGRPEANAAMTKLKGLGRENAGSIEWLVDHYWKGEVVSVEVASYVLLSYAKNLPGSLDDALPVFRGITRQLSESGGFQSTQDTVIGIQAMAKFAEFLTEEDMNLVVSVTVDGQPQFESDPITNANSDVVVIEHVNLTETFSSGTARLSSVGVGSVFTQLVQHYNVRDTSQDPFELEFETVSVVKRDTDSDQSNRVCIRVKTKASENPEVRVPDGMSLLMVEHPTGFVYSSHENEPESTPEKVEQDGEKTTFYFNDLSEEKIITICMVKNEDVSNPRPIFITVQDYYNPNAKSNVEVELGAQQSTDICDLCGQYCDFCRTDEPSAAATPDIIGVSSGWSRIERATQFMLTKPLENFRRRYNLDPQLFEDHIRQRVKDYQQLSGPKLIEQLLANPKRRKFTEKQYREALGPVDFDKMIKDILEHLENQSSILKQILKKD